MIDEVGENPKTKDDMPVSIHASGATFGEVWIGEYPNGSNSMIIPKVLGRIQFYHARIVGDFSLRANVTCRQDSFAAVFDGAVIGGEVCFYDDCKFYGQIRVDTAEIGRNLVLGGVYSPEYAGAISLSGDMVKVRGDLILRGTFENSVNLDAANVAGDIRIEREAWLKAPASFDTAEIGKNLEVRGSLVPSAGGIRFSASGARVRGDIVLAGRVAGDVGFEGAIVDGAVRLGESDRAPLTFVARRKAAHRLTLSDARIERGLQINGNVNFDPLPEIIEARSRPLSFYPGWRLVEILRPTAPSSAKGHRGKAQGFLLQTDGPARLIALDGSSVPIHGMNAEIPVDLEPGVEGNDGKPSYEKALDYLLFFCAFVWGDEGAFTIVENPRDLPLTSPVRRILTNRKNVRPTIKEKENGSFSAVAYVHYGDTVFKAEFDISRSGSIEMISDEPVGTVSGGRAVTFSRPFRLVESRNKRRWNSWRHPFVGSGGRAAWSGASDTEKDAIEKILINDTDDGDKAGANGAGRERFAPSMPSFDLSGAQCGLLDDERGIGWPREAQLVLGGFTYERLSEAVRGHVVRARQDFDQNPDAASTARSSADSSTTDSAVAGDSERLRAQSKRDRWGSRKEWLMLQYADREPPKHREDKGRVIYNPQPYEQLIAALFKMGDAEAARKLSRWQRKIESKLIEGGGARRLWRFFPMGVLHWLYGVCFGRGVSPIQSLVTWALCWTAGALLTGYAASGQGFDVFGFGLLPDMKPALLTLNDGEPTGRPCDVIHPVWYAFDTFVPLVDLKQEGRCDIDPARWGWAGAKALYSLLGWLVTSLALLTVSGILRRDTERR